MQSLPFWPASARSALDRLLAGQTSPQDLWWANPGLQMEQAGFQPDPWQARVLGSMAARILLLCSRQAGKSEAAAALALRVALLEAPALVLILSPTLRQSGEMFRAKVLRQWRALGSPCRLRQPTRAELELSNGSRIVSLPENEEGIRGFSDVKLLVIDEASRVEDALYRTVRPMLAVGCGRLIALSTPFGKRGWFWEEWESSRAWQRFRVTADRCPRISREFLAEERLALGERWYEQEYLCEFSELVGAVFSQLDIAAAFTDNLPPLEFPA